MAEEKAFRRYPGANLRECVQMLDQVVGRIGTGVHDADVIAEALKMSPAGGATKRRIAAMATFGLFNRTNKGYEVTKLAKSILRPLPGELPELLQEAFSSVPLYKEVEETYKDEGRLPDALPIIFERRFGISSGNGEYAARVFVDSARFAGVIDEAGRYVTSAGQVEDEDPQVQAPNQPINAPITMVELASRERQPDLTIELAQPHARLSVGRDLNAIDVRRIMKWLDKAVKPWLEFQSPEELDGEAEA